ncbi:MAG: co-chaperone GroES [Romboutsia sp.]|nr:co-chaperone GroES [Romboutsia sp.]
MSNFKAYNDKVLVDLKTAQEGLLGDGLQEGTVLSIGNLVCNPNLCSDTLQLKVGDTVLIEKEAKGIPIPDDSGKTLYLFRNHQILIIK